MHERSASSGQFSFPLVPLCQLFTPPRHKDDATIRKMLHFWVFYYENSHCMVFFFCCLHAIYLVHRSYPCCTPVQPTKRGEWWTCKQMQTYNTQMNEGTVLAGANFLCKQINNACCMLKDVLCTRCHLYECMQLAGGGKRGCYAASVEIVALTEDLHHQRS